VTNIVDDGTAYSDAHDAVTDSPIAQQLTRIYSS